MNISQTLHDKLKGRFGDVKLGDSSAQVITDPADAVFFTVEYADPDQDPIGTITLSLADPKRLGIIYSTTITEKTDEATNWFDFLRSMRRFSARNMLEFDVQDITKSELSQQDYENISKNNNVKSVEESRMYGSTKTSYQKMPSVRLIVRHTTPVDENIRGARSRRINKIFAETSQGERFLLPTKRLGVARALAQHISSGGRPWDELAEQIIASSTNHDYKKLLTRAHSRTGYEKLVAEITKPEETNMDLQLKEDSVQDLITVQGSYETTEDLIEAVMQVLQQRSTNPNVVEFAKNYSTDLQQAAQLATNYIKFVKESQKESNLTEEDEGVVSGLRQLAMDIGQLDRDDVNMVADMLDDGTELSLVRQYILDLDTSPREAILSTIDSFDSTMMKKLFPKDYEEKYLATMREEVDVVFSDEDSESAYVEVIVDGKKVADGYYDFQAGDAVIDGKSYENVDAIKKAFGKQVGEGYRVLPNYDTERYGNREDQGLEGPMRARNGKVVYYDKAEGLYYDPDSDMFITNDEWDEMNKEHVPGGDMYAAPKKFSHKSQKFEDEDEQADFNTPSREALRKFVKRNVRAMFNKSAGDEGAIEMIAKKLKMDPAEIKKMLDEEQAMEDLRRLSGLELEEDELSVMANSMDKVERTYAAILTSDAEESEVGDYIPSGMTKDQMLKLIDMLEPQGYDKDFLLKDLAPMMEAVVGGDAKPEDPNSVFARLMTDLSEIQNAAMDGNDVADDIADELGDYLRNGDAPEGSHYEEAISLMMDVIHDGPVEQAEAAYQAINLLNYKEEEFRAANEDAEQVELDEADVEESIQYMYSLKDKGMSIEEIAKELNMTPEEVRDAMSKTEESVKEDDNADSVKEIKRLSGLT